MTPGLHSATSFTVDLGTVQLSLDKTFPDGKITQKSSKTYSTLSVTIKNGTYYQTKPTLIYIQKDSLNETYVPIGCKQESVSFDTQVPETFFYSLLANFTTRPADPLFFFDMKL